MPHHAVMRPRDIEAMARDMEQLNGRPYVPVARERKPVIHLPRKSDDPGPDDSSLHSVPAGRL